MTDLDDGRLTFLTVARAIGDDELLTLDVPHRGRLVTVTCRPGLVIRGPLMAGLSEDERAAWFDGAVVEIADVGRLVSDSPELLEEFGEQLGIAVSQWAVEWMHRHPARVRRAARETGYG